MEIRDIITEQGVQEGHADQQKTIVKKNGKPVGEIGIDRESSPGVGQYYMKHYASGTDNSGYDSREEALDDLRHVMKQSIYGELREQGVAEGQAGKEDLRKIIVDILERIYFDASSDDDMTDVIADQLGDYYRAVKVSGDAVLKRAYADMRDTADAPPEEQATVALAGIQKLMGPGYRPQPRPPLSPEQNAQVDAFVNQFKAALASQGIRAHPDWNKDKKPGQGVAEAMKPSDIPPSMRDRLTMRDIESERPAGAFRFRVTFPDGHANDYMTFDAAQAAAEQDQGRITRLSETQKTAHKGAKGSNPRLERILKMLRATHPTAQNDLEALILDFRSQQAQDRTDIARLDAENDMEEADIERLEAMLTQLKQRRATAVAEAAPNEATRFYQQQYQREMQRHGNARLAKELAHRATTQKFGANWNIIVKQPGQPDRYATPADAEMLDRGRRELRDLMANEDVTESLRDGEYHVATVTLDDGTKKKVRITTDEGFRDKIQRHFEKQGHRVTDIDVDYSVRSELDEAKKKPQPTNPELWSRAKAAARSKFDVWPSAYASAWAAKYYKSKGGGWRMGKPKKD